MTSAAVGVSRGEGSTSVICTVTKVSDVAASSCFHRRRIPVQPLGWSAPLEVDNFGS